ncbi:MAG: c-type cytochrome [Candidatus Methylomirabilales bacterium]
MNGAKLFSSLLMFLFLIMAARVSVAAQKGDPKAGKAGYDLLCGSCHGASGKGDGPAAASLPAKPQTLADGKYMNNLTDQHLFSVIKGGGASVGKSPLMPPWGSQLGDQDIWNLVSYIRSMAIPPYKPAK